MKDLSSHKDMIRKVEHLCRQDVRVSGLVLYGSLARQEYSADQWSDVEFHLFVRDNDFERFDIDKAKWVRKLGEVLLDYTISYGNYCVMFEDLLCLELGLCKESEIKKITEWTLNPYYLGAKVLLDRTKELSRVVQQMIGREIPLNISEEFHRICYEFWYHALYCSGKIKRGELANARLVIESIMKGQLVLLFRLEQDPRTMIWGPVRHLERMIDSESLNELKKICPTYEQGSIKQSLLNLCDLFGKTAKTYARSHKLVYPEEVERKVTQEIKS